MVNSFPICVKPSFWLNRTYLRHFHEKKVSLNINILILWPKNDRIELKYVSFMCLQLQEIGQPHLYMCGIFSKNWKFYNYFLSNGIFCVLEWTQLHFNLNEWQKQNCWYIFHYHLLNISWSYTHPIGVKYSILNQCFALVDTWHLALKTT